MKFNRNPDTDQINQMLPLALKNVGLTELRVHEEPACISGEFQVGDENIQPFGVLHGGVSCLIAETLGSIAAYLMLESEELVVVGQSLTASHIRSARKGESLQVECKPLHVGRRSQIWVSSIYNAKSRLVSQINLTLAVIEKPGH